MGGLTPCLPSIWRVEGITDDELQEDEADGDQCSSDPVDTLVRRGYSVRRDEEECRDGDGEGQ